MNRRQFIQTTAVLTAGVVLPISVCIGEESIATAQYFPGVLTSAPKLPLPSDIRAPFGWHLIAVGGPDQPSVVLQWPDLAKELVPTHFRIAIGLDERDAKILELMLPESGRRLGSIELRFDSQFQLHEFPLNAPDLADVRREGLALRLTQGSPLELFSAGANVPVEFLPGLVVPGMIRPQDEFFRRLSSLACVQQFGWMEGCVLDGLLDLAELPQHTELHDAAQRHLALFFQDDRLIYENYNCVPSDDRIYGIEGTLPFAALARVTPQSPLHELALKFWRSRRRPDGAIRDGGKMSSEGSYTVGYALAEIAKARQSAELFELALTQVRLRQACLFDGKEFWRIQNDDGKRGNRNWARGIAWQMLGLSRTLVVTHQRAECADLVQELQRFAAWILKSQRDDGLWSVFVDEPQLTPDTAGSAGIAAALALGAKHGWLGPEAKTAAHQTLAGLHKKLTPDGFLRGVSQSNKGGEGLQRGSYRCIYQMGMGLMAQLIAALAVPEVKGRRNA